jgi:hypothetical protein
MVICMKLTKSRSSKAAEQHPVIMQITPSVAVASVLPPLVGTSLTTCSNADVRHCARWVLQYVESLKDANVD